MKLKALYTILQSESSHLNYSYKILLLNSFATALINDERFLISLFHTLYLYFNSNFNFNSIIIIWISLFEHFIQEELRWQQYDLTHDSNSQNYENQKRKLVSFCKYLGYIFDQDYSSLCPFDTFEVDTDIENIFSSSNENYQPITEYKYHVLLFLNRLILKYERRACDTLFGITHFTNSSSTSSNSPISISTTNSSITSISGTGSHRSRKFDGYKHVIIFIIIYLLLLFHLIL